MPISVADVTKAVRRTKQEYRLQDAGWELSSGDTKLQAGVIGKSVEPEALRHPGGILLARMSREVHRRSGMCVPTTSPQL
ncbi:hypothetical protein MTO96_033231 [Rhipicephalus appendiculatus]